MYCWTDTCDNITWQNRPQPHNKTGPRVWRRDTPNVWMAWLTVWHYSWHLFWTGTWNYSLRLKALRFWNRLIALILYKKLLYTLKINLRKKLHSKRWSYFWDIEKCPRMNNNPCRNTHSEKSYRRATRSNLLIFKLCGMKTDTFSHKRSTSK